MYNVSTNNQTQSFLEELKIRNDLVGVILFGSWARGNNRPDSDVDLVIILERGYQRCIEVRDSQVFEIIYTTEQGVLDFWINHKDDAYELWSVAKILFDKDRRIEILKDNIVKVLDKGKPKINELQLEQFEFDAADLVGYAEEIFEKDNLTAKLLIFNKVFALTGMFFDVRQIWTPAPKQRLQKIKEIEPKLYNLLKNFYNEQTSFVEQINTIKQVIEIVFRKS